ncbi:hypothetical protein DPMN_005499 [Dreissena polymorpha]|uniref:Uncharacterized protein n=1 Tax=Dreissena polymorpha TaxID=45954 RepID=A0A9D4MSC1_DREPO|nr:hypothetical protein DPMN_005499 [Dreissena polymorpha]
MFISDLSKRSRRPFNVAIDKPIDNNDDGDDDDDDDNDDDEDDDDDELPLTQ